MAEWPPWLTITLEDLTDTPRALGLYTSLCGVGLLAHGDAWMSDDHQLQFLALVAYALEYGRNPVALLGWLLGNQGLSRVAPRHETAALERLQAYYIALEEEIAAARSP